MPKRTDVSDELLASLQEAADILTGAKPPARLWKVDETSDHGISDRTDYEAIEQAARDGTLGERVIYTEAAPKMTAEEVEQARKDLTRKPRA